MRIISKLALVLFFLCLATEVKPSRADETITVAHGDQIVLTLRKDGLIDVQHTILLTSNKTVSGVFNVNQSIEGALVGEPTFIADSDIHRCEILWQVEDGNTKFYITIDTTVKPFKFKGVTICYSLNDPSCDEHNGSWYFRRVFSSSSGALAPPEIVVKVPKPDEFDDLSFDEVIPVPHVFMEEGPCYTLIWKSEAFIVGNTSVTLVRLKYSKTTNWARICNRFVPPAITFVAGVLIKIGWDLYRERKRNRRETEGIAKTPKRTEPKAAKQRSRART